MSIELVSSEPNKEYLRRSAVEHWLMAEGFSSYQVRKWIECGVIAPVKRDGESYAWYSRSQIKIKIFC